MASAVQLGEVCSLSHMSFRLHSNSHQSTKTAFKYSKNHLLASCVHAYSVTSVVSNSLRPTDCSPPGPSVHGTLQQEYWSEAVPSSRISSRPRKNPSLLHLLHCRQVLYPLSHRGSPHMKCRREKRGRERLSLVKVYVPPHSFLSILPSFSLLSSLPSPPSFFFPNKVEGQLGRF